MLKICLWGMGMLIVSLILQAQKGSEDGWKYNVCTDLCSFKG